MEKTAFNTSPVVLRKTSLVDFPGMISAVIFFPGCNLFCPWCYNGELVLQKTPCIDLEQALRHIKKRRAVLGGVVLSGGEPTLFDGIGQLITSIKSLGLRIKLDTNGMLPEKLKTLFATAETRPDYIALDLKTSPHRYRDLLPKNSRVGSPADNASAPGEALKQSAALVHASGIPHEFRSIELPSASALPAYFGDSDKAALAALAGDSPWFIRPFVNGNCLDDSWDHI